MNKPGFKGARTLRERELQGSKLLTKAEIERVYGVSSETVTRLIERGEIMPVRIGTIDRVSEREWLRFMSSGSATK